LDCHGASSDACRTTGLTVCEMSGFNRFSDDTCSLALIHRGLETEAFYVLKKLLPFSVIFSDATRYDQLDYGLTLLSTTSDQPVPSPYTGVASDQETLRKSFYDRHREQFAAEQATALKEQKHRDLQDPDAYVFRMPTKRQRRHTGESGANVLHMSKEDIYQCCMWSLHYSLSDYKPVLVDKRQVQAAANTSLVFELTSARPDDCCCRATFDTACQAWATFAIWRYSRHGYCRKAVYLPRFPEWQQSFHGFVAIGYVDAAFCCCHHLSQ